MGRLMFGLLAILASLPSGPCSAAENRLQIGFVSITSTNAPLWVAADRGFLAQEGLDPELIFIGSGPTMIASMMAREVPLVTTAGTAVVSAVAGGAPLKILATFANRVSSDLVARPGIVHPEDLRGKRVGVQSMGGGIWMQALLGLERLGLDPVRDRLHIQAIGPQPQLVKALETGVIDVTVLPAAFSEALKARGYPVSEFDQRAADISVDHPRVVENYRSAHNIALRLGRGEASTEELRIAMIHYRSLFDELVQVLEQGPVASVMVWLTEHVRIFPNAGVAIVLTTADRAKELASKAIDSLTVGPPMSTIRPVANVGYLKGLKSFEKCESTGRRRRGNSPSAICLAIAGQRAQPLPWGTSIGGRS
jgi:hypothetical protein